MQEFLSFPECAGGSPVRQHALRNLAVGYACGHIGIELGILPWTVEVLRRRFLRAADTMIDPNEKPAIYDNVRFELCAAGFASLKPDEFLWCGLKRWCKRRGCLYPPSRTRGAALPSGRVRFRSL